jgi:hypothetical protein
VGLGIEAGQADDRAASVAAPVRREQPGESRDEVDAAVVVDLLGQPLDVGGSVDDAELVPQLLDG